MKNWRKIYLNYACPNCYNGLDKCTCDSRIPGGFLIHIDRNLQQHVHILNKKGFRTIGCCESHFGQEQSYKLYINFVHEYQFGELLPLPNGFKYDAKTRGVYVDLNKKDTAEEREKAKSAYLEVLLNWCENLPENKDKMYNKYD